MAASAPSNNLDTILKIVHNPSTRDNYPILDIEYYAKSLGSEVVDRHGQLRNIVTQRSGVFATRWAAKKAKQRRDILLRVYPNIPGYHRPERFDKNGYHAVMTRSGVPPAERILRFVNLEDLSDKTTLPGLLEARSRQLPHDFAMTEPLFMPLGFTDDRRALSHVIHLHSRDNYGEQKELQDDFKAMDFEDNGFGLGLGRALQVLHAQHALYTFLLQCAKVVLHDHLDLLDTEFDDPEPYSLAIIDAEEEDASFADAAAMTPYRGRNGLHLHRLSRWSSDAANTVKDDIWQLREDPNYFTDAYYSAVEHDVAQVADKYGKAHPNIGTKEFVFSTLNILVARCHRRLILWDQLDACARRIVQLFSNHPEGVSMRSLEPPELVEAIQSFHTILELLKRDVIEELRQFPASPQLRSQFVRTPLVSGSHLSTNNFMKDPLKKEICLLLQDLCGDLNKVSESVLSFVEIRVRLDILETFLKKKPKARELLSFPVEEALTRLSVLTECSHLLELQPWHGKVYGALMYVESIKAKVNSRAAEPLRVWNSVLTTAMDTGFITSPDLGDPSDNKFDYPSHQSKRKKKTIDALRKGEANLDRFWKGFDTDFRNLSGGEDQETLRRLLEERGAMRRTKAWIDDRPQRKIGHLLAEDVFETQPVSQVFHDPSTEITGNLDKLALTKKAKDKTRGTAAVDLEIEDEPTLNTFIDPRRPWLGLGDNSYKVLRALFHIPDEGAVPGVTKWTALRTTMTHLGFSAEPMQGSAWQFTPSEQLRQERRLDRGICFHEPHPNNEISLAMMRRLGARLSRAYGWDGSMFTQR